MAIATPIYRFYHGPEKQIATFLLGVAAARHLRIPILGDPMPKLRTKSLAQTTTTWMSREVSKWLVNGL